MLVQHAFPFVSLLPGRVAEVTFPSAACYQRENGMYWSCLQAKIPLQWLW
jgi:hypothetical protein